MAVGQCKIEGWKRWMRRTYALFCVRRKAKQKWEFFLGNMGDTGNLVCRSSDVTASSHVKRLAYDARIVVLDSSWMLQKQKIYLQKPRKELDITRKYRGLSKQSQLLLESLWGLPSIVYVWLLTHFIIFQRCKQESTRHSKSNMHLLLTFSCHSLHEWALEHVKSHKIVAWLPQNSSLTLCLLFFQL